MTDQSEQENILKFLQEVDDFVTKIETHPSLSIYFIGVVDTLRNGITAARTRFEDDE